MWRIPNLRRSIIRIVAGSGTEGTSADIPDERTPNAHARPQGLLTAPPDVVRRAPHWLSAALAVCVLLPTVAQAQVSPFRGARGPGLSPDDNRLLFASVAQLNAAEPNQVGRTVSPTSQPQPCWPLSRLSRRCLKNPAVNRKIPTREGLKFIRGWANDY